MVVVKGTIPCLLMCRSEVLSDSKKIGDYPSVIDGERLIIQRAPVPVSVEHHGGQFKTFIPQVFYYLLCYNVLLEMKQKIDFS